jgi:ABC-type antimicrobial peptide transport system ATPase subunit
MSTFSPEIVELKALRDRRDKKLSVVVAFNKPAWLIDVSVNQGRSELVFDVVFRPYSGQGWIKRRYRYDGEVDVLHHLGEVQFAEREFNKLPQEAAIK